MLQQYTGAWDNLTINTGVIIRLEGLAL